MITSELPVAIAEIDDSLYEYVKETEEDPFDPNVPWITEEDFKLLTAEKEGE